MGLTKQYLAYRHKENFNIIASSRSNINFVNYNNVDGRYCCAAAAENVAIWDLKLGEKICNIKGEKDEVAALRCSPDSIYLVVGYTNGKVIIFNIEENSTLFSLSLHKSAVSVLRFDHNGIQFVSGGLDNEIVLVDVVTQAGICRLIGHNAPITDVHFLDMYNIKNILVSSSKDTQIKFWNVETQTCFKTIFDSRTEIWALCFTKDLMITGSGENFLNVYRIELNQEKDNLNHMVEGLSLEEDGTISPIIVTKYGSIQREGKGRTICLVADDSGKVITCHGTNDLLESFYIRTKEEIDVRIKKRLKKLTAMPVSCKTNLNDEIRRLPTIKVGNKIKSIDVKIGLNEELRVVCSCRNNSLHLYSYQIKKAKEFQTLRSITQCGHQAELRAICISSDSLTIASASGESIKLWHSNSLKCIRTIKTDYVLSICFIPGDRIILAGMKSGNLLILDINSGRLIEEISAHKAELWSICLLPNRKGCATCSSDTTIKLWNFEHIQAQNNFTDSPNRSELSLLHTNTLKLEEGVVSLKISPNNKYIAVGLLDSTVKIFYLDSFKFYLTLYGHKLPVLCLDISYDSTIIVTGSADRNIKIWGMDFGDCHKSIFAHDDSVMGLQFIPKTHMFFSCGKDGKLKQWDADNFQKIITFSGHIGESNGLVVSPNGNFLVTCGSDRTIRLYEKTEEIIVLQDIQEEEREEIENQLLATGDDNMVPSVPGLRLAARKTVGAEKATENILECLDICRQLGDEPIKEIHPLMSAYNVQNIEDFVIAILQAIRPSDLEESLVILPFTSACEILQIMPKLCKERSDQTELLCKVTFFLFKIHYKSIVTKQNLLPIIIDIVKNLELFVLNFRDMIGYNLHLINMLQKDIEEQQGIELFRDATNVKKQKNLKHKKKQAIKRVHVQMI